MSAQPSDPIVSSLRSGEPVLMPAHPLTVAEYLELGETEPGYTELVEGRLTMVPGPSLDHNYGGFELGVQIRAQLRSELMIAHDMDVDLELAPAGGAGTVRRPDLVVVPREARARVRGEGGVLRASEVILAIEVLSPGSRRTDHIVKRGEYADAGIPHYWIVDLSDPVSLLPCHLAGEFGYADGGVVTGTYSATTPFPVELDLDALL